MKRDIREELRQAEVRRDSTERRLQQLTRMKTLTDAEREEANGLSNALSILALQIRRLRLELEE